MKKSIVFYDAKKKLPNKSGEVLVFCCNEDGRVWHSGYVNYSHEHKLFNAYDHETKKGAENHSITCDFWAYPPNFEEEMQSGNEVQE